MTSLVRIAALLALVLAALASAAPVLAHGGGTPQLVQAPAGSYEIYAWTNPDPARAGTLHVTVALVDAATQQPVLDAEVQIQAILSNASGDAQPITAPATHANAAVKAYYEADLDVPDAGLWQVTVAYGDAASSGEASFDLDVQPAGFNWRPIAVGAVLLVVAIGAWLALKNHAKNPV